MKQGKCCGCGLRALKKTVGIEDDDIVYASLKSEVINYFSFSVCAQSNNKAIIHLIIIQPFLIVIETFMKHFFG